MVQDGDGSTVDRSLCFRYRATSLAMVQCSIAAFSDYWAGGGANSQATPGGGDEDSKVVVDFSEKRATDVLNAVDAIHRILQLASRSKKARGNKSHSNFRSQRLKELVVNFAAEMSHLSELPLPLPSGEVVFPDGTVQPSTAQQVGGGSAAVAEGEGEGAGATVTTMTGPGGNSSGTSGAAEEGQHAPHQHQVVAVSGVDGSSQGQQGGGGGNGTLDDSSTGSDSNYETSTLRLPAASSAQRPEGFAAPRRLESSSAPSPLALSVMAPALMMDGFTGGSSNGSVAGGGGMSPASGRGRGNGSSSSSSSRRGSFRGRMKGRSGSSVASSSPHHHTMQQRPQQQYRQSPGVDTMMSPEQQGAPYVQTYTHGESIYGRGAGQVPPLTELGRLHGQGGFTQPFGGYPHSSNSGSVGTGRMYGDQMAAAGAGPATASSNDGSGAYAAYHAALANQHHAAAAVAGTSSTSSSSSSLPSPSASLSPAGGAGGQRRPTYMMQLPPLPSEPPPADRYNAVTAAVAAAAAAYGYHGGQAGPYAPAVYPSAPVYSPYLAPGGGGMVMHQSTHTHHPTASAGFFSPSASSGGDDAFSVNQAITQAALAAATAKNATSGAAGSYGGPHSN